MDDRPDSEAYLGQSRVVVGFRDFKDPGRLATRAQFHWTDQRLHVHAFVCVTAFCWCACYSGAYVAELDLEVSARNLLAQLARTRRCCTVEHTERAGRPRVRQQMEEIDFGLEDLGQALRAVPLLTEIRRIYGKSLLIY